MYFQVAVVGWDDASHSWTAGCCLGMMCCREETRPNTEAWPQAFASSGHHFLFLLMQSLLRLDFDPHQFHSGIHQHTNDQSLRARCSSDMTQMFSGEFVPTKFGSCRQAIRQAVVLCVLFVALVASPLLASL